MHPRAHDSFRPHLPPCRRPADISGAVALVAVLLAGPATAQVEDGAVSRPTESDPGVVFNLGGGVGSEGGAAILSVGIPVGRGELLLRGGGTASMDFFGPSEATGDLGVLYGVRKAGARGWARVAGGMGIVSHQWSVSRREPCDNWLFGCGYDDETRTRPGLLGQADAVWAPHPSFGIGATLHGGVGLGGRAYGALSIGLYFGRAGVVASR